MNRFFVPILVIVLLLALFVTVARTHELLVEIATQNIPDDLFDTFPNEVWHLTNAPVTQSLQLPQRNDKKLDSRDDKSRSMLEPVKCPPYKCRHLPQRNRDGDPYGQKVRDEPSLPLTGSITSFRGN